MWAIYDIAPGRQNRPDQWGLPTSAVSAGESPILPTGPARASCSPIKNERLGENVRNGTAAEQPCLLPCDVASDEQIHMLMDRIREEVGIWTSWSMFWRSRPRMRLAGMYAATKRADFAIASTSAPIPWQAISGRRPAFMKDRRRVSST